MREFRFIHTADLHLDSPFRGLAEVAPELQAILHEATFRALQQIVDLCLEWEADFLLIAGDVYDAVDRSLRALVRLREQFERLAERGTPVFLCHGNHDPLSGWGGKFTWPENVHVFGAKEVESRPVLRDETEIARVYGISYATERVTENLARRFRREPDAPWAIGLLHTNVGNDPNHLNYAPCELDDLIRARMDYWALGHIHAHRVLHPVDPPVIYPGNPQGRNPRETGPRGCYAVEVDSAGRAQYEFLPIDVIRWYQASISIEGLHRIEELLTCFEDRIEDLRRQAGSRGVIVRWILEGRGPLYRELARPGKMEDLLLTLREESGAGPAFVWSESVIDMTRHELDVEALRREENLLGDFLRLAGQADEALLEEVRQALGQLYEDHRARRYLTIPDDDTLQQWIQAAERLGIDLLFAGEE